MGEFVTSITNESRSFGFTRKGDNFSIEGKFNLNKTEETYFLDGVIYTEPTHVQIGNCYTNSTTNITINDKEYNNLFGEIASQLNIIVDELNNKVKQCNVIL